MLAFALTLFALAPQDAARATLESCVFETDRWVCRYQMPDIAVVPSGETAAPPAAAASPDVAADDEGLSPDERALLLRCGEAGWLSLCTPAQRRTARLLKDRAEAEARLRREVGARLAAGDCDAAERLALEAGDFGLAARARSLCAPESRP